MNQLQRKSTAKFIYDVAKILIAVAVIGNIFSKVSVDIMALLSGTIAALFTFLFAFRIERSVEDE